MSSRDDRRRRDRSFERGDRDHIRDRGGGRDRDKERDRGRRGDYRDSARRSRSRSPVRRGGERDRDRRDYGSDRRDERDGRDRERDRDRYKNRDRNRDRDRLEEQRERERGLKDKDDLRLPPPRVDRDRDRDRDRGRERDKRERTTDRSTPTPPPCSGPSQVVLNGPSSTGTTKPPGRVNLDPDCDEREEGEEEDRMDVENEEEAAMRALMGFGGFDSTKGKPVLGNEEGAVNVKKQRTWRQYMNRKGGFNRPLDKIK